LTETQALKYTGTDVDGYLIFKPKVLMWLFDHPYFNPLIPELNPICYLLVLLAHDFLHVSRIRVKSLTLRLLMSYIQGVPRVKVTTTGEFCRITNEH
jgi:hypothetical protein